MLEGTVGNICIPGMRLVQIKNQYVLGTGTFELLGFAHAALAGLFKIERDPDTKKMKVSVESPITTSVMPITGDIVTAKVNVVNSRQVHCSILCIGSSVLARPYRGILKKEEIKLTDKDIVDPYKCFRPGDIILARVLPMVETHCYHLSTVDNELGVVIATAEGSDGVNMLPISWSEMQCPKTLVKQPRKVARVIPENMHDSLFANDPDFSDGYDERDY